MIVGIPKETYSGEHRVALIPGDVPTLTKAGLSVLVEPGAGVASGYTDGAFREKGAQIAGSRQEVFAKANIITQVRGAGANPDHCMDDIGLMRPGQYLIGFLEPLWYPNLMKDVAGAGVVALSMELMPRISRAQSMDALSAMANISGYKAVLLAAGTIPKMFPMLMTAAGTITPAQVFVIGVGVAGLQAIATAKRLGAKVEAYDVRPEVKDQVISVGAKFVELPLDTSEAVGSGGYAKEQSEDTVRRQRELMAEVIARSDIVITTAAIPGRKSPLLVTADAVKGMKPASVIVDMAAERGGNCELTRADETVHVHGVTILGPTNLPTTVAYHASQVYSRTVTNFLKHLVKNGDIVLNMEDEITRDTLITRDGEIINSRIQSLIKG